MGYASSRRTEWPMHVLRVIRSHLVHAQTSRARSLLWLRPPRTAQSGARHAAVLLPAPMHPVGIAGRLDLRYRHVGYSHARSLMWERAPATMALPLLRAA